ncbi:hypothetical protein SUGI_0475620 [Cryptomeria japonica]|uniref:uncharacterized protein LOC131043446 n=1 Tax=Cryptomeria japonica TaxID=3369 RepID=UPI002408AC70|nr:uncharacterized protein LOC131043446 [Cryptomeria japonica]GLJ24869.1 hypothetical protein SUGI_0475620 [Cryptomeria japonica]
MGEGSLELKIVAAEGLKNVNIFNKGKISPYAVAWVDPQLKKSTKTLRNSGTSPVWNDTVLLPLQTQLLNNPNAALIIQVMCEAPLKTKIIGTTTIMVAEIKRICSITGRDESETFTLQLWRPSGRAYGMLKIALKLKGFAQSQISDVSSNWVSTNPQPPNWALANSQARNWEVTNFSQPCDFPVQGIPVSAMYPPVASIAVPSDATDNSTSEEQCTYSPALQKPSSVVMPFHQSAGPMGIVENSTSNEQCVYTDAQPQQPPAYMPRPPTAPPLQQNNAPKNFLIGLLSGAVAAVLVGSAMM